MAMPGYMLVRIAEAREKQDRAVARGDWDEAILQMDRQVELLEEELLLGGVLAERPGDN
jgi:hypothetical protein